MTPLPNDLIKRAGQPSFETLNKPPVANDTNQAIISVAHTAISEEIQPLREPTTALPKIFQFPDGYRTVLKNGILVHIPIPAPLVNKTGIHTVHDLPPEEVPGLAELRETIQETKKLADKVEQLADDTHQLAVKAQQLEADGKQLEANGKQLAADVQQLGANSQQRLAVTKEIIADTRQMRADTKDMTERVDRLIENSAEQTAKSEAKMAKIMQQTAQLEALNRYLDQQSGNKTLDSFISHQTPPIPIAEPNFLARNWKIIGGGAFCLITLVAVAAIFGIASAGLLSATLTFGIAFFWKQCGDRTSSEKPSTQSLPLKQSCASNYQR